MLRPCPAPECSVHIIPSLFACKRHWFMLPRPIRVAIWDAWNSGDMEAHAAAKQDAMDWYNQNIVVTPPC